jgi:hypothetical protein
MDFVCSIGVPDDELAVLGSRYEMPPIRRPMHRVDLGKMALQCLPSLHHVAPWNRLLLLLSHCSDCNIGVSCCSDRDSSFTERIHGVDNSRVVSASSSFFRFIRSFNVSASRRACWMRDCIASGETSFDIVFVVVVNQELSCRMMG